MGNTFCDNVCVGFYFNYSFVGHFFVFDDALSTSVNVLLLSLMFATHLEVKQLISTAVDLTGD